MVTELKLGMIPLEPFNLPPRHQELQLAQLEEEEQEEEEQCTLTVVNGRLTWQL